MFFGIQEDAKALEDVITGRRMLLGDASAEWRKLSAPQLLCFFLLLFLTVLSLAYLFLELLPFQPHSSLILWSHFLTSLL